MSAGYNRNQGYNHGGNFYSRKRKNTDESNYEGEKY